MKEFLNVLKECPLFKHIEDEELYSMLSCLNAYKKSYDKNELVMITGQKVNEIGIVLSGKVQVWQEEITGHRTILSLQEPGELFAEAFACANTKKLPITVAATTESEVMFIAAQRMLFTCQSCCNFHSMLIRNMMIILADKSVQMNQKIRHISKRTTRDKLLSYLSEQLNINGAYEFDIPFNRQELADYLCVDRSAMSNELSKLRDEGILEFDKEHFRLYSKYSDYE